MGLVTPAEYVGCVEQAYRMHGQGRYYMDPKGHIVLAKYPGEWEAMPSYIEEPEAAACKWVSIRERNREKFDLPTVFSILIYTHPETGFPLAICDGSHHTVMRTGSAAAGSAEGLPPEELQGVPTVGRAAPPRPAHRRPPFWPSRRRLRTPNHGHLASMENDRVARRAVELTGTEKA